uniref:Bm13381 n=1 Tax=Brugia malayi TaxID=6279 RepID=A0A0J9XP65_BRUMA|nr:Bm13381 [Brugia malayi]
MLPHDSMLKRTLLCNLNRSKSKVFLKFPYKNFRHARIRLINQIHRQLNNHNSHN